MSESALSMSDAHTPNSCHGLVTQAWPMVHQENPEEQQFEELQPGVRVAQGVRGAMCAATLPDEVVAAMGGPLPPMVSRGRCARSRSSDPGEGPEWASEIARFRHALDATRAEEHTMREYQEARMRQLTTHMDAFAAELDQLRRGAIERRASEQLFRQELDAVAEVQSSYQARFLRLEAQISAVQGKLQAQEEDGRTETTGGGSARAPGPSPGTGGAEGSDVLARVEVEAIAEKAMEGLATRLQDAVTRDVAALVTRWQEEHLASVRRQLDELSGEVRLCSAGASEFREGSPSPAAVAAAAAAAAAATSPPAAPPKGDAWWQASAAHLAATPPPMRASLPRRSCDAVSSSGFGIEFRNSSAEVPAAPSVGQVPLAVAAGANVGGADRSPHHRAEMTVPPPPLSAVPPGPLPARQEGGAPLQCASVPPNAAGGLRSPPQLARHLEASASSVVNPVVRAASPVSVRQLARLTPTPTAHASGNLQASVRSAVPKPQPLSAPLAATSPLPHQASPGAASAQGYPQQPAAQLAPPLSARRSAPTGQHTTQQAGYQQARAAYSNGGNVMGAAALWAAAATTAATQQMSPSQSPRGRGVVQGPPGFARGRGSLGATTSARSPTPGGMGIMGRPGSAVVQLTL